MGKGHHQGLRTQERALLLLQGYSRGAQPLPDPVGQRINSGTFSPRSFPPDSSVHLSLAELKRKPETKGDAILGVNLLLLSLRVWSPGAQRMLRAGTQEGRVYENTGG